MALATLLACVLAGCATEKKTASPTAGDSATPQASAKRLIFITNGDDPFWDALLSGLKEGEKRFGCAAAGLTVSRDVTADEVNDSLMTAAAGSLNGILGFETRPLVSADYVNDTRSAIVDGPSTMVVDGRMIKILAWYDNEYGYAHRLVELAAMVGAEPRDS